MKNVLISIIIPVYNVEDKLENCLKSLASQTYREFECILVDDGSHDNSGVICDSFCEKDKRFRVIHKKNEGASIARNIGLSFAVGEWVTFVDSDDCVSSDYLKVYMDNADADIVYQGILEVCDEKKIEKRVECLNELSLIDKIFVLEKAELFGYTFNKMFRNDIIQKYGIEYPSNITIREDLIFTLRYILHVESLKVLPVCLYHYIIHSDSLIFRFRFFEETSACREEILKLRNQLCEKYANENYKQWYLYEDKMRRLYDVVKLYIPYHRVDRTTRKEYLKMMQSVDYSDIKLSIKFRLILFIIHRKMSISLTDFLLNIMVTPGYAKVLFNKSI